MEDSISVVKQLVISNWLDTSAFRGQLNEVADAIGVTAPSLTNAIFYDYERIQPPERFPAAEVVGLSSESQGESSAQIYQHTVNVTWWIVGDEERTVVQQVEALVTATRKFTYRQVLEFPSGVGAPLIPGREDYIFLTQDPRVAQPLVKGGMIELIIPTIGD